MDNVQSRSPELNRLRVTVDENRESEGPSLRPADSRRTNLAGLRRIACVRRPDYAADVCNFTLIAELTPIPALGVVEAATVGVWEESGGPTPVTVFSAQLFVSAAPGSATCK
jgi:hypothetical protein